jgi:hypothetical protein
MFEATAKWNRKKVALRIEKGEDGTLDATMKTAEVLWANQSAWARRMSDFAIEKLLPLKNKSWRDDGEPKVKPKEFATRMKLMSIHVSGNGQFEFWHNDDNVFLGHHIQISGNLKDGPTAADIPG